MSSAGTGKTATFSISILQRIDTRSSSTQALILAPTRELAQQIQKVVLALGDYMNVSCHSCIGGTLLREDMRRIQVCVGGNLREIAVFNEVGCVLKQVFENLMKP